jgi:hypothetical protein
MKIQELRNLIKTEVRKVVNESQQIKEAKKEVMTLTYNTDPDDLAYIKKILKASGIEVAVAAGTFDDEVLIIIEPGQEQKVKKALQKNGFDI